MGLTVRATGLDAAKSYDGGYITFGNFRLALAETFNKEYGLYYKRWVGMDFDKDYCRIPLSEQDHQKWVELQEKIDPDGALFCFLSHPDGEGKFTPQECRKIYNRIKELKMDFEGHNYGEMKPYNMLEQWKGMFLHCTKRRVNLYFS